MFQIRPGRSWRHNPSYASELARLEGADVRAFDGARILDVLGVEVDGVDIAAGVGEAPLCAMVDELVQAALQLARGEPAAQATVGPGPTQMVLEPRGPDVLLTLLSLRPPARVLAGGLLVDGAKLRAAALGAAQRVLADLLDVAPALRGSPFVRRITRDLRELARTRATPPKPWPPERLKQAGFVVRSAKGSPASTVRLEVKVPAPSAARLAARAQAPHAPLAALLGSGSLALRFSSKNAGARNSLASKPSRASQAQSGLALSLEAPPYLALRELLRSCEELVRAFESGEPAFLLRWGSHTLRCDLTRDELRAEGLRDAVRAQPLALAEACATAARAFARRALALKAGPRAKAPLESDSLLTALDATATALLKHCRDLASGDLRRAPDSVRAPLPAPAPAQPAASIRGSVRRVVHRLAFEIAVGPIGESGLHVFPTASAAILQSAAGLLAIDLATSARLWHLAGISPAPQAIARASSGDLFALHDDALLRLDPANGESRFRRVVRGAGTRIFAVPGGCAVSLASGGIAFVRDGGALAFRVRLPEEPIAAFASDGILLVQLESGQLAGLDLQEGAELWRRRIGVRAGRAQLSGTHALASAVDARGAQRIVALSLSTGETLWERPLPARISNAMPATQTSSLNPASALSGDDVPGSSSAPSAPIPTAPPELILFGELCATFAGRGILACHINDGAPAFTRDLPWGPHGRLHALEHAAQHTLLALGPGAAALHLDHRGQPRWSRPALSPKQAPPQMPAQLGPALLLAESATELIDLETGRLLARPSMADTDAAALLPDLSVLIHLRDGTLALMRLATHLSLV